MLLENTEDINAPAKMSWRSSAIDLAYRYKCTMNNTNINAAKELTLTEIEKY